MSAESDMAQTTQSIELCVDQITGLRVFITDRRIHYLAHSATQTMRRGVETYWNKHYNLQSGQTRQLALFQGGGDLTWRIAKKTYKGRKVLEPSPNSEKFRSRNGQKRLVAFTFGKPTATKDFQASNLSIHSFPMNWYERDVMLKGWSSVDGKIRKGTHIMKRFMPTIARAEMDKTTAPMLRDIEQRWNEMGNRK